MISPKNLKKKYNLGKPHHCLPQKLKSMFFFLFVFNGAADWSEEKIPKNVDFSLGAGSCAS